MSSWHQLRLKHWFSRHPTFEAILKPLARGHKKKLTLRLIDVPGSAMTVLDCAKCGWRIWLEAHHQLGSGKPWKVIPWRFESKEDYERYKKWRTKMLRSKTVCPKCKNDTFKYVRTEVMDHGRLYDEVPS